MQYFAQMRSISLALAFAAGAPWSATASAPSVADRSEIYLKPTAIVATHDGARIAVYCVGHGSPTVVMDAGLGDGATTWAHVQPEIARHTRVCSYDRAGYMFSSAGPMPRTSDRIVSELHDVILGMPIAGPVVLVGHSFGSLNVRLFTDRYPALVAGVVTVDGSHEDQTRSIPASMQRFQTAMYKRIAACGTSHGPVKDPLCEPQADPTLSPPLIALIKRDEVRPRQVAAINDEFKHFELSATQVRKARRSFGSIPMVVVTGAKPNRWKFPGVPPADSASMAATWTRLQNNLATLSKHGEHVTADDSNHYVQVDAPWVVTAAVTHVVDLVRAK